MEMLSLLILMSQRLRMFLILQHKKKILRKKSKVKLKEKII
jgi:hypothetical protein